MPAFPRRHVPNLSVSAMAGCVELKTLTKSKPIWRISRTYHLHSLDCGPKTRLKYSVGTESVPSNDVTTTINADEPSLLYITLGRTICLV